MDLHAQAEDDDGAPPATAAHDAARFERDALILARQLVEIAQDVPAGDGIALALLGRNARTEFGRLRGDAAANDYHLVRTIADGGIAWCEDRGDDPRLPRAVRAHASAIITVVAAGMQGERQQETVELMAGLVQQLHESTRAGAAP